MRSRYSGYILFIALIAVGFHAAPARAAKLKTYETKYYTLHTDVPPEEVQEVSLRMSRMAEEYYERTQSFSGRVTTRLPFFLFQNEEDYIAAGAPAGSAGVFMRRGNEKKLMAIAGEKLSPTTWHVIQHEGFHQFADATIGDLPTWVNEGLAEYFGEAVWTGDGFVAGMVPPRRLKDIQQRIGTPAFRPLPMMMRVTLAEWNQNLSINNYHQAWAMSHFLAHADEGKYQKAFVNFVRGVNRRIPWEKAWLESFGTVEGFEKVWAEWWMKQQPESSSELETRIALSTLASFAARANAMKQLPTELNGLIKGIESGEMKFAGDMWLPPSLFQGAVARMKRDPSKYSFIPAEKGQLPKVLAERPDGTRMVASFPARFTSPMKITIDVDDLVPKIARAQEMQKEGKKKEAKALLAEAMKRSPKSPATEQAKKLMIELR